MSTKYLGSF